MASRKFELEIDLKSKGAEKDLKKFNKTLDDTNKKTKSNKKATDDSGSGFAGLTSKLGPATKALVGVGVAVTAGVAAFMALDQAIRAAAQQARELENMARVADTTVSSFQAMNIVAQQFGVTGEKLADQIKDFQDKLGDFTANQAGPFKDIMKLIGDTSDLTADQLAKMAGPEAVGAVIKALKGANLTTSEMKFALESLASDLVLTQGAFENNAQAITDTEKQLAGLNAVVNEIEIRKLKEYADSTALIDAQWNKFWTKVKIAGIPIMEDLGNIVSWALELMNEDSERDKEFLGLKTKAEQVAYLKNETKGLKKELDTIDAMDPGELFIGSLFGTNKGEHGKDFIGKDPIFLRKEYAEELEKKFKQIRELENQMFREEQQNQANIQAGIAERVRLNEAYADQFFKILGDQDKMSLSLKDFNAELARTAFIDGKLKGLKENYSPEQIESIRKAYGDFYDERIRLTQAEKDSAQATKDANKALAEKKKTLEDLKKVEIDRVKRFKDTRQSMQRELALLNANNAAERTKLELAHQAQDLNLTTGEAGELEAIQAQIDARQKHLDILEKEKEAVQNLAEAMGRWASGSKDAVKQVIAELIRLVAIRAFGGTGAFGGGFLTGFGSGGMNGYAEGGNFKSGETFMVGERGPEIITASAPGSVIPNHQLGGSQGMSIAPQLNIYGGVNNADELNGVLSNFANEIAVQTKQMMKTSNGPRGAFA